MGGVWLAARKDYIVRVGGKIYGVPQQVYQLLTRGLHNAVDTLHTLSPALADSELAAAFHRGVDAAKEAIRSECNKGDDEGNYYRATCINAIARKCGSDPRSAPARSVEEAARRAVEKLLGEFESCLLVPGGYSHELFYGKRWTDIIAAEFASTAVSGEVLQKGLREWATECLKEASRIATAPETEWGGAPDDDGYYWMQCYEGDSTVLVEIRGGEFYEIGNGEPTRTSLLWDNQFCRVVPPLPTQKEGELSND